MKHLGVTNADFTFKTEQTQSWKQRNLHVILTKYHFLSGISYVHKKVENFV